MRLFKQLPVFVALAIMAFALAASALGPFKHDFVVLSATPATSLYTRAIFSSAGSPRTEAVVATSAPYMTQARANLMSSTPQVFLRESRSPNLSPLTLTWAPSISMTPLSHLASSSHSRTAVAAVGPSSAYPDNYTAAVASISHTPTTPAATRPRETPVLIVPTRYTGQVTQNQVAELWTWVELNTRAWHDQAVRDGSLDRMLDWHFPGLRAAGTLRPTEQHFRLEMAQPSSQLFLHVFATMNRQHPFNLRPNLSVEQLVTLALLGHPDRIANLAEMNQWILSRFLWFRDRRFFDTFDPGSQLLTLEQHIRSFFRQRNRRVDESFRQIDPASRRRSQRDAQGNVEELWSLDPGAENPIFHTMFQLGWPPGPAMNLPHRSPSPGSSGTHIFFRLPPELRANVLRHIVVFPQTINVVDPRFNPGTEGGQYFVDDPEWLLPNNQELRIRLSNFVAPPNRIPGNWIDLPQNIFAVPEIRDLALRLFFTQNTFSFVSDGPDRNYTSGYRKLAPFFSDQWVSALQPSYRHLLRRVVLHLDFNERQRRRIGRLLIILGNTLDPHITLVINATSITAQERANPETLPGMQILRRFRGCRHINVVIDGQTSGINDTIRNWVSRSHHGSNPSGAYLPPPRTVSQLARQRLDVLIPIAERYGYNSSRYIQLPDGNLPTRSNLAQFIHAEQSFEYYDDGDLNPNPRPERPRPSLTLRPAQTSIAQQPQSIDPAVQWMQYHVRQLTGQSSDDGTSKDSSSSSFPPSVFESTQGQSGKRKREDDDEGATSAKHAKPNS